MNAASRVLAVAPVPADHRYPQAEITEAFARICGLDPARRPLLERVHGNAGVTHRHLALPLEEYPRLTSFTEANDAFVRVATELGARAVRQALHAAGLDPEDVDLLVSTTVTGVAVPSLEARIAVRLGMRPDVRRVPLLGLGCVGGAAGLARVHDHLRGSPDQVAVLLSVELCSLTLQRTDGSTAALVASGLFGDGAAAVVVAGGRSPAARPPVVAGGTGAPGPWIVDSRSHLYPATERVMGWDVGASGFTVVLSPEVPDVVRRHLGGDVGGLLADHGLTVADVAGWVCHPGGPKVIEAIEQTLGLGPDALALTRRSLRRTGNLSSASVLFVLHDTIAARRFSPGAPGVLLALGPGFCSEVVLLRW